MEDAKIIQIAVAVAYGEGVEIKRTACVDDRGRAYELHGTRWVRLPDLPKDA